MALLVIIGIALFSTKIANFTSNFLSGLYKKGNYSKISKNFSEIFREISPIEYNIVFLNKKNESVIYIDFSNLTPNCVDYVKINNKIVNYSIDYMNSGIKITIDKVVKRPFEIEVGLCNKFLKTVVI